MGRLFTKIREATGEHICRCKGVVQLLKKSFEGPFSLQGEDVCDPGNGAAGDRGNGIGLMKDAGPVQIRKDPEMKGCGAVSSP